LNHFLFLSTYSFFPICCTISNDLKFSSMQPTCLEELIQRITTILDIFSYKCDLLKCSYLLFDKAKKVFLSIQILMSCNLYGENFWNFFHIMVLQDLMITCVQKCFFFFFFFKFGTSPRNGSFGVFLVKT